MSFVPIGPRMKSFIGAMSGSVLIALLAPIALNGDAGARLALLATGVMMLLLRKPCRRLPQVFWLQQEVASGCSESLCRVGSLLAL